MSFEVDKFLPKKQMFGRNLIEIIEYIYWGTENLVQQLKIIRGDF